MMSLTDDIIQGFNTTSRYLDDILSIHNTLFDDILIQMYSSELQLNKAYTSDTKAVFLDLHFPFLMILFLPKFYHRTSANLEIWAENSASAVVEVQEMFSSHGTIAMKHSYQINTLQTPLSKTFDYYL